MIPVYVHVRDEMIHMYVHVRDERIPVYVHVRDERIPVYVHVRDEMVPAYVHVRDGKILVRITPVSATNNYDHHQCDCQFSWAKIYNFMRMFMTSFTNAEQHFD